MLSRFDSRIPLIITVKLMRSPPNFNLLLSHTFLFKHAKIILICSFGIIKQLLPSCTRWTSKLFTLEGKLHSVEQYTIVAFIRDEHSNCLPEVGCLPEGFCPSEDNPARVNNLDVHLVHDGNNCFIIPKLHIRIILACLNKNVWLSSKLKFGGDYRLR
jgi:hypothetical protein